MSACGHSKNIKHLLWGAKTHKIWSQKVLTGKKIGNTLVRRASVPQVMKEPLPEGIHELKFDREGGGGMARKERAFQMEGEAGTTNMETERVWMGKELGMAAMGYVQGRGVGNGHQASAPARPPVGHRRSLDFIL